MGTTGGRRAEHRFFGVMAWLLLLLVVVGFGRTFFFRAWFPELSSFVPPERYFNLHGAVFTAWFVLLVVQAALVATRRVAVHRTLGWVGTCLAGALLVVGYQGSMIAARRPAGFLGIDIPAHQFLIQPLADLVIFALFVTLAVLRRDDAASHKRYMLVASANLVDAAVARLPFDFILEMGPIAFFAGTDLLLLALAGWDLTTRRRLHRATIVGLVATVASQVLRLLLMGTDAWAVFARWLIG